MFFPYKTKNLIWYYGLTNNIRIPVLPGDTKPKLILSNRYKTVRNLLSDPVFKEGMIIIITKNKKKWNCNKNRLAFYAKYYLTSNQQSSIQNDSKIKYSNRVDRFSHSFSLMKNLERFEKPLWLRHSNFGKIGQ